MKPATHPSRRASRWWLAIFSGLVIFLGTGWLVTRLLGHVVDGLATRAIQALAMNHSPHRRQAFSTERLTAKGMKHGVMHVTTAGGHKAVVHYWRSASPNAPQVKFEPRGNRVFVYTAPKK